MIVVEVSNPRYSGPSPCIQDGGVAGDNTSHYRIVDDGRPEPSPAQNKPPYRVPSMAEIEAVEPCGLVAASTFSGCGGSCLGYRMAGFHVAWANECDPAAIESYLPNHLHTMLDQRDIREVKGAEILEICGGKVDLLDGSPPCVSFSSAGQREKSWNKLRKHAGITQRTDDLFAEYIRLIDEIRPRAFIAENVAGMVRGVSKGHFIEALRAMRALGYVVKARVLDAQWLGVPQHRERLFFVGFRDDLGVEPEFPTPMPYRYSLAEACPWLVGAEVEGANGYDGHAFEPCGDEPAATVQSGRPVRIDLPPSRQKKGAYNVSDTSAMLPSPTVTVASPGNDMAIPGQGKRRKFTIAELKRVCSFPDDFDLRGTYAQQWARLGNSVPPLMARAVGSCVRDVLLRIDGHGR